MKRHILSEDSDEAVHVEDEPSEEIGEWQFVSFIGLVSVAIETVKNGRIFEDAFEIPQRLQVCRCPFLFRQKAFPFATDVPFGSQYLYNTMTVL